MKSMTKLMVVAMILVAALVVAPAAARSISDGDTIYVGEDDLDVDSLFGSPGPGTAGTLVWYSSVSSATSATVGKTIAVANVSDFDLTSSAVGSSTGAWYAFTAPPFTNQSAALGTVLVEVPSVSLDVLQGSGTTSVNGKSVTRGQDIRFQIQHNVGTLPAGAANVEVRVTTPAGGTVTTFEGVPLNVDLSGTQKADTALISLRNATTGTYTAQGVWKSGSALYDKGYSTSSVTFEVTTGSLAITASKDTVIRNSGFTVTITGESNRGYLLNVTTTAGSGYTTPMIVPGQIGVMPGSMNAAANGAIINTTASGTRSIEFNTTGSTDAKTYTIEVKELAPGDKSDDVRVKVEAGSVTVTSSGTGTYYIGEEVTLSGTNTEGETVYLFMTGPNLDRDGVNPTNVTDTTPYPVSVEADDTWSYKWNTAATTRNIDAGSYTIYAVSKNVNKDKLSSAKYDTVSVSLRSGFISATTSGATVARGNDLTISGTAQGNPDNVFIWIFGKNYYGATDGTLAVLSPSIESDGTFEDDVETDDLAPGQYFVVVQHPMGVKTGDAGSINWNSNGTISGPSITTVKLTSLQAPAAASALIAALDSPNIPDTYVKLTFVIAEPQLFIDPIGDKAAGSKFTISGTTNLAVGDTLNVEVTSAAFQPGQKTEGSTFSGVGGSAIIQQGDGMNTWSFEVDGTGFKVDQYIVTVESIDAGQTATTIFNVVEGQPTTQPTGNVTTAPTGTETTPTTTTTTQATPTTTPGFGALLALAGLGAVAFLVLRRD